MNFSDTSSPPIPQCEFEILNDNGDSLWNQGEIITFYVDNVTDKYYDVRAIDIKTASLVMYRKL